MNILDLRVALKRTQIATLTECKDVPEARISVLARRAVVLAELDALLEDLDHPAQTPEATQARLVKFADYIGSAIAS